MNQFYARNAAVGLCLYSLRAFPPELLERVLRTHPEAVHNGHLCANKFFEPPQVTLSAKAAARAGWMLDELRPSRRGVRPLRRRSPAAVAPLAPCADGDLPFAAAAAVAVPVIAIV